MQSPAILRNATQSIGIVLVGEPRIPSNQPQYQALCAENFATLQVGEHVTNSFCEYVVTFVVKAANGVVLNVELEDERDEITKIQPEDDFNGWWIEF